jgi:hypothetical protein
MVRIAGRLGVRRVAYACVAAILSAVRHGLHVLLAAFCVRLVAGPQRQGTAGYGNSLLWLICRYHLPFSQP